MSNLRISKTLADILDDTQNEIAEDRSREPLERIKRRISTAPPILSFSQALAKPGCGIIAEIKEQSPSKGPMLAANVEQAPSVYKKCKHVRAISVLTSRTNFGKGMTLERMQQIKQFTQKPVLRKDFIIDEYQIYQARAYGADAILLMANILKQQQLKKFYALATELGLDVLFETHEPREVAKIPESAKVYGINSRNFCSAETFRRSRMRRFFERFLRLQFSDLTIDTGRFSYYDRLPERAIKVAESGVTPDNCKKVFEAGFNAILVGTALLFGPNSVDVCLADFERQMDDLRVQSNAAVPAIGLAPSHA
jgi:indole-3-glycerol phosphate synthase